MNDLGRNTHKIIDLKAVRNNYNAIDSLAPNSKTIAVIKADAYGHGALAIAKTLEPIVPAFAVAFIDEALLLRSNNILSPVLILEGPLSKRDINLALQHNLWLMIHSTYQLDWLLNGSFSNQQPIWIKVDTGMSRLGFSIQQLSDALLKLNDAGYKNIILCSHCSCADDITNDKTSTQSQQIHDLAKRYNLPFSLANSASIVNWPETHGKWNRLGIALYGGACIDTQLLENTDTCNQSKVLEPVMTLQSSVIALRELNVGEFVGYGDQWQASRKSIIATIAIGYGDGYPRSARLGTPVLINNTRVPLVGRVSMDMITVDVTDLPGVLIGDKVELWGKELPVEIIAECANTINYELLTRISARVKSIVC